VSESLELTSEENPVPDYSRVVGRVQVPKGVVISFGRNLEVGPRINGDNFKLEETETYECIETPLGFWLRLIK
jgi:hypothetical protein